MRDVATQRARYGWGRVEHHILAAVVSASKAELARVTRDVGLDRDFVSNFECLHGLVNCDDLYTRIYQVDAILSYLYEMR